MFAQAVKGKVSTWLHRSARHFGSRAFWAAMLVAHAPAWLACFAGGELHVLRAVVLTLSQLLFVLKLLDVPWLRLRGDRRTWLVVIAGIALLHGGVVHRALAGAERDTESWQAILALGGVCGLAVAAARLVRRIEAIRPRAARDRCRANWEAVVAALLTAWLPPRFQLLARACSVHRGPPA